MQKTNLLVQRNFKSVYNLGCVIVIIVVQIYSEKEQQVDQTKFKNEYCRQRRCRESRYTC